LALSLRETAKIRRFLNFAFLWAAFDALARFCPFVLNFYHETSVFTAPNL